MQKPVHKCCSIIHTTKYNPDNPDGPSADKWINKMQRIYTMNIICQQKERKH